MAAQYPIAFDGSTFAEISTVFSYEYIGPEYRLTIGNGKLEAYTGINNDVMSMIAGSGTLIGTASLNARPGTNVTEFRLDLVDTNSSAALLADSNGTLTWEGDSVWRDGIASASIANTFDMFSTYSGYYANSTTSGLYQDNTSYASVDLYASGGSSNVTLTAGAHSLVVDSTGVLSFNGSDVWHSGNDGASSGLDADLLDGQHASAFQPADAQLTSLAALSYAGNAGKVVAVNAGATDFELITAAGTGTVTSVNITAPAAGITASGGPITTTGAITLALADDLAAVEGLATTGIVRRTAANTWTAGTLTSVIGATFDGGGAAITAGSKVYVSVPFDCTLVEATALADVSGSAVVDVWKDTYANYPPTDADSITASAPVTISSATKSTDATLTGWTTTVTAGDVVAFNVDSCSTITKLNVQLVVERT